MAEIISISRFKGVVPKINAGTYTLSISLNRIKDIRKHVKANVMSHAKSSYNTTYFTRTKSDAKIFAKIMNHDYRKGSIKF